MTVREIVSDGFVVASAGLTTFGAWQIYEPAAAVVGGLWLALIGYLIVPEGDG
jgi:small neutral amino acid transporter SnatA (MarC family)